MTSPWIDARMSELQIQEAKFRAAISTARASFAAPKRFKSEEELFEHLEAVAARAQGPVVAKLYQNNGPDSEAIKFVRKFYSSGELSVEVKLNSFKRRQIHEAAAYLVKSEGFKISHESHGPGYMRCLVLRNLLMAPTKKEKEKEDLNACGCLAEDPKYCICKDF